MSDELRNLRKEVIAAEKKLNDRVAELYPEGSSVIYSYGRRHRRVTILAHGGDRVRVEGPTGKRYWIYHYSIWGR